MQSNLKKHRPLPKGVPVATWDKVDSKLRTSIREAIESQTWPIYLCGPQGTGKTCAAACVYCRWSRHALWHDHSTVIREVIHCRTSGTVTRFVGDRSIELTEGQILHRISEARLLVFDDIAIRPPSDARYEAFYEMVNSRVGKPTIYTANIEPEQIAEIYDERMASRILAGATLMLEGDDRRTANSRIVTCGDSH